MPRPTWTNLAPARRERVLQAAMAEFGRHGYSGGSLNVIAREAGVAKGSLFQYFDDKFDFFAHVAEQASLRIYAAMQPYLDKSADESGQTFTERLGDLVEVWIDYMADHPLERGITAATTMELDPQVRTAVREPVHRLYVQGLRPLVQGGVNDGQLRSDTDVDALLAMLILLLPHLALAPFEAGLDSAVPLHATSARTRAAHARRLVDTLLTGKVTE